MKIELKTATIFPKEIHSGITLTQINANPFGASFAISKVGKKYSIESIRNAQEDFSTTLGVQRNQLQFLEQIHSDTVHLVNDWTPNLKGDAIISSSKSLVLCISVADCVGITLYDQEHQIIAGVHSGWRGTFNNIVGKTILTMVEKFSTNPSKLFGYVSPSASQRMYQVQNDVSSLFDSKYVRTIDTNIYLDVQTNVLDQLIEMGMQPKNIEQDRSCTISDLQFHSFRRDGEMFGLNVVYIHQYSA